MTLEQRKTAIEKLAAARKLLRHADELGAFLEPNDAGALYELLNDGRDDETDNG